SFGDLKLSEVHSYKYLGYIFHKNLRDNDHMNETALKAKKLNGYIKYTLNRHMNVKRIDFGNQLYKSKLLSSVLHSCAIWASDNKSYETRLKSMQYNAGRAIFDIKGTPAYEAIVSDLGWTPMKYTVLKRQVEYYIYIKSKKPTSLNARLLASMEKRFEMGKGNHWNYVKHIDATLKLMQLSGISETAENISYSYHKQILDLSKKYINDGILEKSSLDKYHQLNLIPKKGRATYLYNDYDFQSSRIKFLARAGKFNLNSEKSKWKNLNPPISPYCEECPDKIETLEHRLFECPSYETARNKFYLEMKNQVPSPVLEVYLESETSDKLKWIIGDEARIIGGHDISVTVDRLNKILLKNIF
ncbi:unnamed protein product, partial [Owenia fusiformis]